MGSGYETTTSTDLLLDIFQLGGGGGGWRGGRGQICSNVGEKLNLMC